jgi:transposase
MERQTLKITHFTAEELRLLLTEDHDFRRAICLFACYHIAIGKRPEDIASFYGTSPAVVAGWIRQLNEGGIEGLTGHSLREIIPIHSEDRKLSLMEIIRYRQPADYGFHKRCWTLPCLTKLLLYEFQAAYRFAQLCRFFGMCGTKI